ncbi:MAG: FG-GAP-like repeat-containing protein [Bacteroidota bacterium]
MNNILVQIYYSTSSKYIKFRKRLDKSISTGKFRQFTKRKQSQLLHKIERLRRRVMQLQTQLKLAAAGATISLFLNTSPVQAQTSLGPFVVPPPPLPFVQKPVPTFVDLDGDGDLDLVVGDLDSYSLHYFKNTGTSSKPNFEEISNVDSAYPFGNVGSLGSVADEYKSWVPAFTDVDGDGDYDLLLGVDERSPKYGTYDGPTYFFRNIGSATSPDFTSETGSTNPFDGIKSLRYAHPTFADLDNDGDSDLLLGGYYRSSTYDYLIQYWENTGTASAPAYVQNTSISLVQREAGNHLFYDNPSGRDNPAAFADLDEDGDLDFFFTISDGTGYNYSGSFDIGRIIYLRNDGDSFSPSFNGIFPSTSAPVDPTQTGPWMEDPGNPGKYLGNPFDAINQITPSNFNGYTSIAFADLDGDGDLDVTVGYDINDYYGNAQVFVYYENTGHGFFVQKPINGDVGNPLEGIDVGEYSSASFADIDGDGDIDVLASGNRYGYIGGCECYGDIPELIVFENDNGEFVEQGSIETDFSNLGIKPNPAAKLIDVNGDGRLDLVVPVFDEDNDNDGYVQYFEQDEYGEYNEVTGSDNPFDFISFNNQAYEVNLDLGDLDDDGDFDLIISSVDDELSAYKNTGTAQIPEFTSEPAWEAGFLTTFDFIPSSPKLIDLDHDGDLDIIVGKYDLWYYENTGTPAAPEFTEYDPGEVDNPVRNVLEGFANIVATPSLFDSDGDGDEDLISGNYYGIFSFSENVNTSPVTTIPAGTVTVIPGVTVHIVPTLDIVDEDNDLISQAIVSIEDFRPGEEILAFTPLEGITGSFNNITGVLTLTGKASISEYKVILKSITYQYIGPSSGGRISANSSKSSSGRTADVDLNRVITFKVLDQDFTNVALQAVSVAVSSVTVPKKVPTLLRPGNESTFTPSSGPQVIASGLLVSAAYIDNLQSARVFISNFVAQDELIFVNQNGITGNYNAATGELLLTGSSSVANYQDALRSVQFNNPTLAFTLVSRTIEFSVNDGTVSSNVLPTAVNLANQSPSLSLSTTNRFYGSGDLVIDNNLNVIDTDNPNLQSAEVVITTGFQSSEDVLAFTDQSGITGSYNNVTGVLTLTGSATKAEYQTALQSVIYKNSSVTPNKTVRTITFRVNDGNSFGIISSLVLNYNSAPVINVPALTGEVGQKISVDLTPLISDPDNNLIFSTIKILTQPTSGATALLSSSLLLTIDYEAFSFAGNDQLTVEACDVAGTCTQSVVNITVNNVPPAINVAPVETAIGGLVSISLTPSISDSNNNLDLSSLTISQQPISGALAIIDASNTLVVDYTGVNFAGTDNLKITVCDAVGACIEQTVTIEVNGDIEVHNGMSPNGDELNKYFELGNIVALEPNNKVSIYTRWGDKVFEIDNYNNLDRRFEGIGDNGKELVSGIYFYKVEFTSGRKELEGYLTIKR